MDRNYTKILIILVIPLLVGVGIGYGIKASAASESSETSGEFKEAFPTAVRVQDKPAETQDPIVSSRRNAITSAIARVSPATVGINVTEIREQLGFLNVDPMFRQFFGNDPFLRQFVGPQRYEVKNLGSGVVISPDGYIVTNYHVAGNAKEITVTFVGGK